MRKARFMKTFERSYCGGLLWEVLAIFSIGDGPDMYQGVAVIGKYSRSEPRADS